MSLTLDLLRHGEPVGGPRYRGQTDDPLSGRGWLQMHRAVCAHVSATSANTLPWQHIYSSPLCRCRAFAHRIARQHGLPMDINAQMSEIDFGHWEGRTAAQLMRNDAEALGNFWRDPVQHTPHGGETLLAFRQRIIGGWQQLLDGLAQKQPSDAHVLMISHGGVMRILLHHILGIPLLKLHHIEVPYGCLTRIHIDWHDGEPSARLASHGAVAPAVTVARGLAR